MNEDVVAPTGTEGTEPSATERVIETFGGIRPMAAKLDVPVTTVQGWKKRNAIPRARHADILVAATKHGLAVDPELLAATDPNGSADEIPDALEADIAAIADPVAAPVRDRQFGRLAIYAAVVTVVAMVAMVGAFFVHLNDLQKRSNPTSLEQRVAALEARPDLTARIAALEARPTGGTDAPLTDRLAQLEQQVGQVRAQTGDLAKVAARLNEMQVATQGREILLQTITDVQASLVSLQGLVRQTQQQLQAQTGRIESVEATLNDRRAADLRNEAVVLAVGQLRAQTQTARPFDKQIAALRSMAGADVELLQLLDRIQDGAENGVPTREELRAELTRQAPELVRSAKVGDGNDWWNQAMYRVSQVISIRRVGADAKGDGVNAAVARAEAMAEADDLQGAVQALKPLTGLPADVVRPWLRAAERRLNLDDAGEELQRIVIERLGIDPTQMVKPADSK
ncbi:COG4223 family protein [Roseiterribacter gracilis]|uniref:Uncharacterized protein n=1 Tax=Roseiterribacter gracilis TaxID=2812848 RepID=A0A8S8XFK7_9PROT|nr:hypothetical protein TMPK1_30290 [Rhodospirillales bacterium TMPK1]